jgi:negative regulator of sigma-B (phosphoserine phosphatase)
MSDAPGDRLVVECASAGAALESVSGDVCVVAGFDSGALVAVIDGLGHGPEAADAAHEAARVLGRHAGEPVSLAIERCHEALRKTRGAVMTVASFDARNSSMRWLGVGNVEGILVRADRASQRSREAIALRGGVVGYQLPPLREWRLPVAPGDTLVLATDGIRSAFAGAVPVLGTPQQIADEILGRWGRGSDDALVLVTRYLGAPP